MLHSFPPSFWAKKWLKRLYLMMNINLCYPLSCYILGFSLTGERWFSPGVEGRRHPAIVSCREHFAFFFYPEQKFWSLSFLHRTEHFAFFYPEQKILPPFFLPGTEHFASFFFTQNRTFCLFFIQKRTFCLFFYREQDILPFFFTENRKKLLDPMI